MAILTSLPVICILQMFSFEVILEVNNFCYAIAELLIFGSIIRMRYLVSIFISSLKGEKETVVLCIKKKSFQIWYILFKF